MGWTKNRKKVVIHQLNAEIEWEKIFSRQIRKTPNTFFFVAQSINVTKTTKTQHHQHGEQLFVHINESEWTKIKKKFAKQNWKDIQAIFSKYCHNTISEKHKCAYKQTYQQQRKTHKKKQFFVLFQIVQWKRLTKKLDSNLMCFAFQISLYGR